MAFLFFFLAVYVIFDLALYEVFAVFAGYKHLISGNELEIVCMQEFVVWFSCNRKFFGLCHLCRERLHDKCLRNFLCSLYWEIFCGFCKCKFVA